MKKNFPKIVISVIMIGIFLAPVVPNLQTKDERVSVSIESNTALAVTCPTGQHDDGTGNCVADTVAPTQQAGDNLDFGCGYNPLTWFRQCIITTIYYIIFIPLAWVSSLAANILDFFIYYSTNSSSYSAGFVSTGWKTVRDIANIFFIIALLYIAIQTILDMGSNGKKMIANIIVVALMINFSLFFTQVVIDSSNILAKVFYNQITPQDSNGTPLQDTHKQKSITVGLVDAFSPETMLHDAKDAPGRQFMILILLIIMSFVMIYVFISIALLFVARVAGLWLAMIFSPVAFASITLPFKIPSLGWDDWKNDLLKQAFMAPILVFFLYIILLFGKNLKLINADAVNAGGDFDAIMKVIIPFFIVMVLLLQAKKLAGQYSGEIGKALNSAGGTVLGFAAGAVTGGAAVLGQKVIGGAASRVANNDETKRLAAGGNGISKDEQLKAQKTLERANRRASKSYDLRQTSVGGFAAKKAGLDLNSGTGALGMDTRTLKGGYRAKVKRATEKEEAKLKTYEISGEAASTQNHKAEVSKVRNEQYEKDKKEAQDKGFVFNDKSEQKFKEAYEKGEDLRKFGLDKKSEAGSVAIVKDSKEINMDRRKAYADSLVDEGKVREVKGAMKSFFSEWGNGMKTMTTSATGIGTIATAGTFLGPAGALGALLIGSLNEARKNVKTEGIKRDNSELISSLRKGQDPNKAIIDELKKMNSGKDADYSELAKKIKGEDTKK
ncbi:MAG: hypothetical protein NTW62_02200 [Candidatus Nomurabacteria bacterium]|nr:hypothetical protein [Candidatus Nomurabacteria bacterium]